MNFVKEHITHPQQAYRVLRLELGAFGGARHRHRQLELTWIERGTGLRFVGDSVQPFDAGDLVLLGANLPHAWVSAARGVVRDGELLAATVLQFPPELLEPAVMPELSVVRKLAEQAGRGLRIDEPGRSAVTAAMQRLPGSSGMAGLAGVMEVLAQLVHHQSAMQPLASAAARPCAAPGGEQDRRIARVVAWVRSHLAHKLGIESAAALVHVSPAAFSRFFKREVGKSFTEYVNDVRCGEACLRLRGSDQAVASVAQACGFDTLSHFNCQFKRRMGLTPREFRRGG